MNVWEVGDVEERICGSLPNLIVIARATRAYATFFLSLHVKPVHCLAIRGVKKSSHRVYESIELSLIRERAHADPLRVQNRLQTALTELLS